MNSEQKDATLKFLEDLNIKCDADIGDDDTAFFFESDHLAVRGNRDYSNLLRTICILQAQRIQVLQRLEELELAKKRYLENPDVLLNKIRNKEELTTICKITIPELPEIGNYHSLPPEELKIKDEDKPAGQPNVVRGRLFDETKPETFNQLWTCEEQRRLEELLIEYPVEAIESRRFSKIAKALGNRTPQQVASRVQKYFKKLHDAGMPIPGRIPKSRRYAQSKFKNIYRPTTFFPAHNVSVHMPEDDLQLSDLQFNNFSQSDVNNAIHINAGEKVEMKKRILDMLEVMREEKRSLCEGYNPDPMAPKCENCQIAPVSSIRWRCNTCFCYVNQCSDCIIDQLLSQKFEHLTHDVVKDND